MNTAKNSILPVLVGSILFGVVMALRYEVSGMWPRALIAAAAFVIFGAMVSVVVSQNRSKKREGRTTRRRLTGPHEQ